jgi:glycosyltransferase involved in cell wall biosynthesis
MRVAYVSPHAVRGGAERVTMDLLALHDRDLVEPVAVFLSDGPLVAEARALGIEVEVFAVPRMRSVLAAERAKRALAIRLAERHVDLVHGVMAWGHCYAGAAAQIAKLPAVWFQHDVPSRKSPVNWLAALTPAKRVFANSAYTARAQHRLNPRRVKIEIVYPGTQIPQEPWDVRRRRGREALGIASDEFAVGVSARLQRWKGQDVVVRAAASLLHARPDSRLFLIGDTLFGLDQDFPAMLRQLAAESGIAERVVFAGFRSDPADYLAALDVAVHASVHPEAFGLALVEAMAAGTALVVADSGAVREIVEPGTTAFLVPPGDHEALATILLALHDDPARRRSLAAAGAEAASVRFDMRKTTRRVEQIYRDVLAR